MSDVNVTVAPPALVNVTVAPPPAITVAVSQQQGLPGRQGDIGPPGEGATHTFTQSTPSAVWLIAHGMGRYPSVEVTDSTGRVVEGDPQYIDANTITIAFSAPFSGVAYLN